MYGLFESHLSIEEISRAIDRKLVRSTILNWDENCFIGKAKSAEFKISYHKAYCRDSFEKKAYGWMWRKEGKTKIIYFLVSPFLNWKLYLAILILILTLNFIEFDKEIYLNEVSREFYSSIRLPLLVGFISQVFPTPFKKKKIDGLIVGVIEELSEINDA